MLSWNAAACCRQYETNGSVVECCCKHAGLAMADPEPDQHSGVCFFRLPMPVLLLNVGSFNAERRLEVVLCSFGHLLVGEVRSEGIGRPAPAVWPSWTLPGSD